MPPPFLSSTLTVLPLEILDAIAFEAAALQPLGPPSILMPLLRTCRGIFYLLSPRVNHPLWAKIFRYKFDAHAVQRRVFLPTAAQQVDQLVRYCQTMQVLRCMNRAYGSDLLDLPDIGLDEALMTAVVMMLEDDGKNARQLCEWARADDLARHLVQYSMFREMRLNNGWPVDNQRNACAMWLMWMLTSQESLENETVEQRRHINAVLLPFVTLPYRYSTSKAPPQHFSLPFPPNLPTLPTTIHTAHGPYPVWPQDRSITEVYYGSRPTINFPLIAPAAKLLFFARQEMAPLPTPPHFARNRAERLAEGNLTVGPTQEDVAEFNWGWSTRLPQGESIRGHSSWTWGVGDDDHLMESFAEYVADEERSEASAAAAAAAAIPFEEGGGLGPPSRPSDARGAEPPLRWAGKAPHSVHALGSRNTRSMRWDPDWWRMRLCGDPRTIRTRVPYGRVFKPGSMDGFWHGRFLIPAEGPLQALLENPLFPGEQFTEESMRFVIQPFYIRLREAHGIVGFAPSDLNLGTSQDGEDEGMNNAWFDGALGSTTFSVRPAREGERLEGEGEEVVSIQVIDGAGRGRRGVFPCWKHSTRNPGLGNDSLAEFIPAQEGDEDANGHTPVWMGYPHDAERCSACQARLRVQRQLERERKVREAIFASVGLGRGGEVEEGEGDESQSTHSYDSELDELEPVQDEYSMDGVVYPALPRTHDRRKLAHGACDGVRDVYVVGETDGRHDDAWGGYEFYGRVRDWDGLVGIVRRPKPGVGEWRDDLADRMGYLFFYGYLVGGENWVGNWRFGSVDEALAGYEGPFVMSRRYD